VGLSRVRLTEKGRQHSKVNAKRRGGAPGIRGAVRGIAGANAGERMMHRTVELFCVGLGGLFGFFFDRGFGGLKPDAAVRAIAKGLRDRATTAAEGESRLAGKVVFGAVRIHQLEGTFWSFHAIRAILSRSNFNVSHSSSLYFRRMRVDFFDFEAAT
jgi:hypothetical protein